MRRAATRKSSVFRHTKILLAGIIAEIPTEPLLELIAKMRVLADQKWKELQRHWVEDKATWEGFEHLLDAPTVPGAIGVDNL